MNNYKIGFFGGCFNPPTIAHIELAKKAIEVANLDKLIFIPMGDCYPKEELIPIKHRYEMLKIATKNEKNIEVSDMQFNQENVVYAIDTFRQIDEMYSCEKFFIMGADNFLKIKDWKDSKQFEKYKFIVFERENTILNNNSNITFINSEIYKDISSRTIRNDLKLKKQKNDYIQKEVFEYIQKNNLYS